MTIKTLHITNSYHPASGGIRTFYQALLTAANLQQRPVRLVVPAESSFVEQVGRFGRIYFVSAPRVPVLDSRYRWLLPHTYAWPFGTELRRILAVESPDLVEVCDKFWLIYLSGILRRGRIPGLPTPAIVGLTCERLDDNLSTYISAGPLAHSLYDWYMRTCYAPRFDFHLAASEFIADELRPLLPERLKLRLRVAPMGVDFSAFAAVPARTSLRQELLRRVGGDESTLLVLYAGRLAKEKHLSVLPPTLQRLVARSRLDCRLLIAGEGPYADTLRDSLERMAPGRTLFLGHCQRDKLPSLFHAADLFLHPNPREPFGIAPLEAMSAGLPLVAPASGGVLTYASPQNAWLVAGTPESFADAVEEIHAGGPDRRDRIENARRTAERFSWPSITENYFRVYDEFHRQWLQFGSPHSVSPASPPPGANVNPEPPAHGAALSRLVPDRREGWPKVDAPFTGS